MKKDIKLFDWSNKLENIETYSIDNDFILLENPVISSELKHPFIIDVTTVLICVKGSFKGSTNLVTYSATAPCMYIILPNQILQYEYFSDDFSSFFIVLSQKFINNLLLNVQERLPLFISVQKQPWTPLSQESLEQMKEYYQMLKNAVLMTENPYRAEIVKHLIQAFFYASSYQFHNLPEKGSQSKQEILVEKFLTSVQKNYKEHRGLEFYANELCLTPKYLSKLIKENSGTTANEWINNYVILEAKALLKSTNMTIQQISLELNFESQSFFGKYFKRIVGLSPKEYRIH